MFSLIGATLYLILTQLWWFLPLVLFISYPFAWLGHYLFEKNEPAAFHDPVKAKIASWMMFWDVLSGVKLKFFNSGLVTVK